jgi:hypothetical protein
MKVYENTKNFSPITIILETADELVTLKEALIRAEKETNTTIIPIPFGIQITVPPTSNHHKYREMLRMLNNL